MKPNIHLKHEGAKTYRIILCDESTLELSNIPAVGTCDDIVMQWPLNPHFTGAAGIASMLQNMPHFTGATFITEKAA